MATTLRRRGSVSATTVSLPAMVLSYIALFAWAFVVLFPLYWLAVTALKTPLEVNGGPFYIPWRDFQPTLDSWHYIFFDLREDTFRPYLNTGVVGLTSTAITVLLGSMAAYALVRMRYQVGFGAIGSFAIAVAIAVVVVIAGGPWPLGVVAGIGVFVLLLQTVARRFKRGVGNDDIAFWMISQRMLPPVATIIPIYIFFQQLQLLDTWGALIISYTAAHLPIVVWLMRDYFQSIPIELEECAAIDGASRFAQRQSSVGSARSRWSGTARSGTRSRRRRGRKGTWPPGLGPRGGARSTGRFDTATPHRWPRSPPTRPARSGSNRA